jgi:hypothetical protein
MPTPRQHGGAALALVPLTLPGFKGLNSSQQTGILGPEWATKMTNAVIDDNARVAARAGWNVLTTSAAADDFVQLYSHLTQAGTERIIAASATKLYSSSDGGASWTDRTGAVSTSVGNWAFTNFNDAVYGIQSGHAVIKSTTGNFADVATSPSGNAILGAYGRVWASDSDGFTLKYSALLNGDDWTGGDTGSLSLKNVWPGTDSITALGAFNNLLVVFGNNNIVLYTDGTGSKLGINPTQMYVADIITGTGCVARDSVQSIDGDLWFYSNTGLQSLSRLIQERSNPLNNLSRQVQDLVLDLASQATSLSTTRSVYSPKHKLYLLSFPVTGSTGGSVAFDTRGALEDGSVRCMGLWTLVPMAITRLKNNTWVMSITGKTGKIGSYSGALDDTTAYDFDYESGWLDLTDKSGYLLIAKRYSGTFYTDTSIAVTCKWAFDFSESFDSASITLPAPGTLPEFGVAEFGIAEFGGGIALRSGQTPTSGTGQYVKLGISAAIAGQVFSIQQLNFFCKIGRYA